LRHQVPSDEPALAGDLQLASFEGRWTVLSCFIKEHFATNQTSVSSCCLGQKCNPISLRALCSRCIPKFLRFFCSVFSCCSSSQFLRSVSASFSHSLRAVAFACA
jgi:hypothetical protein